MKPTTLLRGALGVLAVFWTVPGRALQDRPAVSQTPPGLAAAHLEYQRQNWAEAVDAARRYLQEAGPGGKDSKEARVLLCQARSHLPDEPPPAAVTPSAAPQKPAGEDSETIRIGGKVQSPKLLHQVPPQSVPAARTAREKETVLVEAVIDQDGCVLGVKPLNELPPALTAAALEAVRQWVFLPAMLENKPIKTYYIVAVDFGQRERKGTE